MSWATETVESNRGIHNKAKEWRQHINSLDDKSLEELYLITRYGSILEKAIEIAKNYE